MKMILLLPLFFLHSLICFSQNVGIGTFTPEAKLDVRGTISLSDSSLYLRSGVDHNHGLRYSGGLDGPYLFGVGGGAVGTINVPKTLKWDNNGNISTINDFVIDYTGANAGALSPGIRFGTNVSGEGIGSNRSGAGVNNNGLDFYTNNSNRMLIDHNGVIGIGTNYPANFPDYKLSVTGTVTVDYGNQNNGTIANVLNFGSSSGAAIGSNRSGGGTNDHGLDFYTGGNKQMSLNTAGQLGIGTATPAAKLDVEGNVKIADGTQGDGKILTSDANGNASWRGIVACSAGNSGANTQYDTIAPGYHWIMLNTEIYDDGGNNYDPTTGIFTAPVAGIYHCDAVILLFRYSGNSNGRNVYFRLDKNNAFLTSTVSSTSTEDSYGFSLSMDVKLVAGDFLRFSFLNGSSDSFIVFNSDGDSRMSIHLVR